MISHKHRCIFIHIPKCAGSSIFKYFIDDVAVNWKVPNYDVLYGWCPERNLHLQHATTDQLIETGLISRDVWESYFKFTFVRNPYDRAYSDYLWVQKDRNIFGSFKDYILKKGVFKDVLLDNNNKNFRGDHCWNQTDFFYSEGDLAVDYVGRFENLKSDFSFIQKKVGINKPFHKHEKKNDSRYGHYSKFYTKSKKELVENVYRKDLEKLNYSFDEKKKYLLAFKKWI